MRDVQPEFGGLAKAAAKKRRGGSGCGNVEACSGRGGRRVGRVGPSVRKITRARNENRPGTSGGGRKWESEALNLTASVGIRLWAVFKEGSAHEPPPENVASERDAVEILDYGEHVRNVYAPEPLDSRFMIYD